MKKKLMIISASVLGLGIAFGAGNLYTKAGTDWSTNAQNAAYSELLSTANKTTNDLTSDADTDISNKINGAIQGTVEEQQAELQKLLDQYYQMKIDGLTSTDAFKQLEQKIKDIQASVLASFKQRIDEAINNAQKQ